MSEDSSDNDDISLVRSSTKKRVKKSFILSDDSSGDEDKNDSLRYKLISILLSNSEKTSFDLISFSNKRILINF